MSTTKPRLVACPNCRQYTAFTPQNPFRPFCSERCKLIDLGLWADEQYKIAAPINPNNLNEVDLDDADFL